MKTFALLALLVGATLAGCGGGGGGDNTPTATPPPRVVTVRGTFLLRQEPLPNLGPRLVSPTPTTTCKGRGGYSEVGPGMEVLLTADGKTLSVGRFSTGTVTSLTQFQEQCEFTFELQVPEGYEFYNVKVGRRGDRTYSWAEITTVGSLSYTLP